jgi:hypothetical protein
MKKFIREWHIGDTYGYWTVTSISVLRKKTHYKIYCKCICGVERYVSKEHLVAKNSVSCGCVKAALTSIRVKTHDKSKSLVYKVWGSMKQRCQNSRDKNYPSYGGRGITVCERWQKFENFYVDMGSPPFEGASLDRIDNSKNYALENCRWATRSQQMNNTRGNAWLTYDGKTQTLSTWAAELSLAPSSLCARLGKLGWSVSKSLSTKNTSQRNIDDNPNT